MFRLQRQNVFHCILPAGNRLNRQTINQVQRQVGKAGLSRGGHGPVPLLHGVGTVDGGQLRRAGRLYPQGNPVEARLSQGLQRLEVRAVRVGLEGDLRVLVYNIVPFDGCQQLPQALFTIEGGGAAAEIDGVH